MADELMRLKTNKAGIIRGEKIINDAFTNEPAIKSDDYDDVDRK